ncbi:response regulator transcription factor [Vibrio hippocampi]|uniref:Virulence factors putative positive transcription regulator BvgA n=1 Tax=Vibrio hippocampi TaxID=654686 RepID=A0ABN8DLR6_9VIBR|nr:response regulator transcription factor [Vibrio hippocampi]CAH0530400.1 Virulence factors putative positive transcription regulator BvgA [Vibrio hippocampi]
MNASKKDNEFSYRTIVITNNELFYCGIRYLLEKLSNIRGVDYVNASKLDTAEISKSDFIILDWDSSKHPINELRKCVALSKRVLVFSQQSYAFIGTLCIKYKAAGYMCKHNTMIQINKVVNQLLQGGCHFEVTQTKLSLLSKMEYLVAESICEGLTNREIANKLNISDKTVSTYKMRIYNKLQIKSNNLLYEYIKWY